MLALLSILFTVIPPFVVAQTGGSQAPIVYDSIHNATSIIGTWSTGSGAVSTGPNFINPLNYTFNYPQVAGVSYSFTEDHFFEQAEYRFTSNASDPHCIIAVITWQHGTYALLDNGSIILTPFSADGRQQVQDPCAAISNQIYMWNATILFSYWRIFALPSGGFHLHLYKWDGTPVAPMSPIASPPSMLPTVQLTNAGNTVPPPAPQMGPNKRGVGIEARSDASRTALVVGAFTVLAGMSTILLNSM